MKLLFCSSIMLLLCLILTLIIDAKGQSARRVLCQSSDQCQEGQYCDLRPVTCNMNGCFGECKTKATQPPCPKIRDCGTKCCEREEFCDKPEFKCRPLFDKPSCPFDRKCGSVCCPEDEFCSIMSMPMKCMPRLCPPERQCEDKCCRTSEICLQKEERPPKS